MPGKKMPKNPYCRNSKLSEEEFRRIAWGFLNGWSTVETRKWMLSDASIKVSERTIWQYYRRIGLYLFEMLRDPMIEEIVIDAPHLAPPPKRGKLSPEEHASYAAQFFEGIYDHSMRTLTREEYWTLYDLGAPRPKDFILPHLRALSTSKRGITSSKIEHVALAYYLGLVSVRLEREGEPKDRVYICAQESLLRSLIREPL